jgi:hypothetical protein
MDVSDAMKSTMRNKNREPDFNCVDSLQIATITFYESSSPYLSVPDWLTHASPYSTSSQGTKVSNM